ncbi:MAG: alanine--tRNA ligase, partial [Bacteroidetes bacterium]|nr:alanine--tRNA ligase [Bacteroidota bacterium]
MMLREKAKGLKSELLAKKQTVNGINFIAERIELDSADAIKDLLYEIRSQIDDLFMVIGAEVKGKPSLSIIISDNLVKDKNLNAGNIMRDIAKEIKGGGGGQPFYANAGGSDLEGIAKALEKAKTYLN